MTPRLGVVDVSKDADIDEALMNCIPSGHTRLPVYEGSLDNIVGVVDLHDLFSVYASEETGNVMHLTDLMRSPRHVPESKNIDELLDEKRNDHLQMAIVIDEFGTTKGITTMEGLIEAVVGQVLEGDETKPMEMLDDGSLLVRGETNIEQVNAELAIDLLEGKEFETIAEFIFNRAGCLVEQGETFIHDGVDLRVE